jgi:hypothetical protein
MLTYSRTILSYPLCPIFVVFCNVVSTSSTQDYQLLQNVVETVSSLVAHNKYVERLHRLCNTLLSLCKPLLHQDTSTFPHPGNIDTSSNINMQLTLESETITTPSQHDNPSSNWDDKMIQQLFQAQPSLDWFDSDILDPALWNPTETLAITPNIKTT